MMLEKLAVALAIIAIVAWLAIIFFYPSKDDKSK